MSSILSLLLCVFLALSYLEQCTAVTNSASHGNNESDEQGSDQHTLGWVQHTKIGDVYVAKGPDVKRLVDFIALQSAIDDGTADFASLASEEMEDGPELEFSDADSGNAVSEDNDKAKSKRESEPSVEDNCTEEVNTVNYYPEYAIGRLENGCTAFLVGPYHAMTSAQCVYKHNQRSWEERLDFWRGRNDNVFLKKMIWKSVVIPRDFFERGDLSHNWALITFEKKESISAVWLKFEYSPKPITTYVTKYGYKDSTDAVMVSKVCQSMKKQENVKFLNLECCEGEDTMDGGPILKGYRFNHGKMPHVCGITGHSKLGEEVSIAFNSDMFWSACYLLGINGFEAQCGKV